MKTTPLPKKKIARSPISPEESMYQRLVSAIVEKGLRPGERVNELQLAEVYGIPRTRVRRVLERLELEGVIEFKPNRGAFISRPSVKEARDVFEARVHLEAIVFRLACERATKTDVTRLRKHLQDEKEAFANKQSGVNQIAGNFHILVAEIADNSVLLDAIKLLIHRVCLIQSLYETTMTVSCFLHEHEALVDMMEKKDIEGIVKESILHCEHILQTLDLSDQRGSRSNIYTAP
jgi:DNA-binding GntR family transcriptional regulator